MLRKWIVLNIFISILVIVVIGYSMKEYACYQFQLHASSSGQSEQFRHTIEMYLLYASAVTFVLAVAIHHIFARKILQPLRKLASSNELQTVASNDEIGQIAKDMIDFSNQVDKLQRQNEQMLADLAHELRTPLTTLQGYLEGLNDGIFSLDDSTATLLKKECERMVVFIERLQAMHEWEKADIAKTEVRIDEWIDSVLAEYANEWVKAGLRVQSDIQPAALFTNLEAVRTVLRELLENVLHFHEGSHVFVKGFLDEKNYILSISNEGMPIPPHAEKQLFERFFRVEPSRNRNTGGTGLGLALAKQIVQRLGGDIGYFSNEQLHTFWFSLPLNKE